MFSRTFANALSIPHHHISSLEFTSGSDVTHGICLMMCHSSLFASLVGLVARLSSHLHLAWLWKVFLSPESPEKNECFFLLLIFPATSTLSGRTGENTTCGTSPAHGFFSQHGELEKFASVEMGVGWFAFAEKRVFLRKVASLGGIWNPDFWLPETPGRRCGGWNLNANEKYSVKKGVF